MLELRHFMTFLHASTVLEGHNLGLCLADGIALL